MTAAIALSAILYVGCTEPDQGQQTIEVYPDIVFDSKEVYCNITPEADTLYFGFHRRGADTLTDKKLYFPSTVIIDRWSTAKLHRDFKVDESIVNNTGFSISCNLTLYAGNFYIVVNPDMITEPKYIKLFERIDSMTIHLIPTIE